MNIIMEKFAYYTDALKKYAQFKGRANRAEFWYFVLFNFIIGVILGFIGGKNGFLRIIYSLLVLIPSLALGARRLHDIGKSGWWQLIALIPFLGGIWLIVLLAQKGDEGPNGYGAPSTGISGDIKKDLQELKEKASDLGEKVSDKMEDLGDKAEEVIDEVKE